MRNITYLLSAFCFFTLFESCSENRYTTEKKAGIPLKVVLKIEESKTDSIKLSEIASKVEYIPLETSSDVLLGLYNTMVVTKDNFFLQEGMSVLRFNKEGEFINNIYKTGRGPGEVLGRFFSIDEANRMVYVYSHVDQLIKVYSFDGAFIKNIGISVGNPVAFITSIGFFNNNILIREGQSMNSKNVYSSYDLENDSLRILYKNYNTYNITIGQLAHRILALDDYSYQITDSSLLFKERFCDTIFSINKDFLMEPRYLIDLDSKKLTWEDYRDNEIERMTSTVPLDFPFGYWVQSFAESNSFLFFVLRSNKEPQIFAFYNKVSNSVTLSTNKYFKYFNSKVYLINDIDKIVSFSPMSSGGRLFYYDECLYNIIEGKVFAESFKDASYGIKNSSEYLRRMAPVLNSVTEFSNPVIMKIYLK